MYGLVAPGYEMAAALASRLLGGDDHVSGERPVDEAQAARRRRGHVRPEQCGRRRRGRTRLQRPGQQDLPAARPRRDHRCADRRRVRRGHVRLRAAHRHHARSRHPARRSAGVRPAGVGAPARPGRPARCRAAVQLQRRQRGHHPSSGGRGMRNARRRQGGHVRRHELRRLRSRGDDADPQRAHGRSGVDVSDALCEHFDHSRRELFDLVRFHGTPIVGRGARRSHGRGRGCEICRPTVASILASLSSTVRPRRRSGIGPGHERPPPRQHAAQRHLLGGPPGAGRRDHPRSADRARHDRQGLRAVHEDHRRPAHRPARGADSTTSPRSGVG